VFGKIHKYAYREIEVGVAILLFPATP